MAERTVGIYPETRYNFRSNASYREPWNFLPNARAKVIAEQLTYLDFHEWLMDNVRHASQLEPEDAQWSELVFNVAEGFYKTDVLLYASICEAALHSVLRDVYWADEAGCHQTVKDCFRRVEDRFHRISSHKTSIAIPANPLSGQLCLRFSHEVTLGDAEIKFASLIRAGEAIGIYSNALRRRLDTLRDDRNAIHLAKQIERNNQLRAFNAADRTRAKGTTDELQIALRDFIAN